MSKQPDVRTLLARLRSRMPAPSRQAKAPKRQAKKPKRQAKGAVRKVEPPRLVVNNEPARPKRISQAALLRAKEKRRMRQGLEGRDPNPFRLPSFPPEVIPKDGAGKALGGLAHDAALPSTPGLSWAASQFAISAFWEGQAFLGYQYLAQLAQRPEFRKMSERIATEATRKWIKLQVTTQNKKTDEPVTEPGADPVSSPVGTAANDADPALAAQQIAPQPEVGGEKPGLDPDPERKRKAEKVKKIEAELVRLRVRDVFRELAEQDGFFGITHLYLDTGDTDNRDELVTPLGDGSGTLSRGKVTPGKPLKRLKTVEPVWCYPSDYNTIDPLDPTWYRPEYWYVMGKKIHRSRLLSLVSREVPDLLKPAYAFGGLSLSQMAKPYVDNWLRTRQAVADLIESFSTMILATDMQSTLAEQGISDSLYDRMDLFNEIRSNRGLMAIQKDSEELTNVTTPLSTLDALQAQSQEQMASVCGIPIVILLGIQPMGLNASSEGEIRVFYDLINAYQHAFFGPPLTVVINFVQLSLFGEIDPEITFSFEPLWTLDAKGKAEVRKTEAETDTTLIDGGVIHPEEARQRLAGDPESPYASIDPEDVPEPPVDPMGEGGFGEGPPGGGAMPGGGAAPGPRTHEQGAADGGIIPFVPLASDDFVETDHPRDDGGKFTAGGGGGGAKIKAPQLGMPHGHFTASGAVGSSWSAPKPKTNIGGKLSLKGLKKVGAQKGSNPGGVYEGADGERFYVKKGKTADHVRNEMIAARLYDLAGTPTLKYRPVDGGEHIATEMAKLDKDNASKLSKAERREAQEDFAVHAWLGNWDAVGLGGDNLGVVNGRPTALDVGGALEYRAQGAPKGKAFGTEVGELATLRDKGMNSDAAGIFGDMTPAELRRSARYVTALRDHQIRNAVEEMGGDAKLADKLIARRDDIARQARTFGAEGDPAKPNGTMVIPTGEKPPIAELNGVAFSAWEPPVDWATVEGQNNDLAEPEFDVPKGKTASSGVVIRESDGRVWLVQPKGAFGGYEGTFPKGGVEQGLSMQANAIKEAWEESGLQVKIVGHVGDYEGDMTKTRYYMAERVGGDPSSHDPKEVEGVVLVPESKAKGFLSRERDQKVLAGDESPFDESKHPRDNEGKFTKGAGAALKSSPEEDPDDFDPAEAFLSEIEQLVATHNSSNMTYEETATQIVELAAKHDAPSEFVENWLNSGETAFIKKKWGSIENAINQVNEISAALEAPTSAAPKTFASKKDHVAHLLTQGTTTEEILKATGWPSVSVPAQAKAAGLKLVKWKENGVTKYKGTPMTAEEKAAAAAETQQAKAQAKAAVSAPKAPSIPVPPAQAQTQYAATPQEIEKAKKTVALQLQYVPGAPQTPEAQKLVDEFNKKYANMEMPTLAHLQQKVADFKAMQAAMVPLMDAQQKAQHEAQQKAAAEQKAKAAAEAKKQAAELQKSKAALDGIMKEFGLSDADDAVAVQGLMEMMGVNSPSSAIKKFTSAENPLGQHGVSNFEYSLLKSYTGSGYASVNKALRSGTWTVKQHMFAVAVNKALKKMPTFAGTTKRGISGLSKTEQAKYQVGHIVPDHGFMSTSKGSGFSGQTRLIVTGKSGRDVSSISLHPGEAEVLYPAMTMFRVDKVEGVPGGSMTVHMTEVEKTW